MKFALNYSPQAAELCSAGQIKVDLFKCPPWPETVAAARRLRPTYVHFVLRAGRGRISQAALDRVSDLLDNSDTPLVSVHLSPCASDLDAMPIETCDAAHRELLVDAMITDVMVLVERFGAERVIAENLTWAPQQPYEIPRVALEPEVITCVIGATGCGFLLDLAHARIAAKYLKMPQYDYVSSLPTDRLCELHVTGIKQQPNGNWHDHYEMRQDDWTLLEWAIDHIAAGKWAHPWVMALEYGGVGQWRFPRDRSTILQQAQKLHTLSRSI